MYGGYAKLTTQVDPNPVDGWTLVHLGYGVAAGVCGAPMLLTLAAALFWEAAENWNRPHPTFNCFPEWTPEVNINILFDIVVALGGWGLGAAIAASAK